MTKAAESLTAQLDSQGKLTTPRQKNIKKSRHEIEILKASEHATHVCKLQIYIEWHQKNIPQNLMSLYPFKFVLTPPVRGALSNLLYRYHRYLMTRLSFQVVYLSRHVSSTAPPFILWWWNLEILFAPLNRSSPFIGELRCQAVQMEHGPYIAVRIQSAVYIYSEMSVMGTRIYCIILYTTFYLHWPDMQ
jgi:hypothetical protein